MFGFADLVDHLVVYSGRDATRGTSDYCRRAAQQAITLLPTRHPWNWYRTAVTIQLTDDYTTGTITYDATTRQVTLTGGTWPTWAIYGTFRVNTLDYDVAIRNSGTVITLGTNSSPPSSISTPTGFELRRFGYQLPANFSSIRSVTNQPSGRFLSQALNLLPGTVWTGSVSGQQFAVGQDANAQGRQIIYVGRGLDRTSLIQVFYQRTIGALRYEQWDDGFVAVSGTAVTGTNTKFRTDMAGMIFRASSDDRIDTNPTNLWGLNPQVVESLIYSVASPESLTLTTSTTEVLARARAVVTSLLDVAEGPMWDYLLRLGEQQFRLMARMAPYNAEELRALNDTMVAAKEDDNRYQGLSIVDYPYLEPIGVTVTSTVS